MDDLEAERRKKLKDAGLTQEGAADLLAISRNSVVRWLKGGDQTAVAILNIDDHDHSISVPIELGLRLARRGRPLRASLRLPGADV